MEREPIYYLDPETDLTDSDATTHHSENKRALLQYLENCDKEAILDDGVFHKYALSIHDKFT